MVRLQNKLHACPIDLASLLFSFNRLNLLLEFFFLRLIALCSVFLVIIFFIAALRRTIMRCARLNCLAIAYNDSK